MKRPALARLPLTLPGHTRTLEARKREMWLAGAPSTACRSWIWLPGATIFGRGRCSSSSSSSPEGKSTPQRQVESTLPERHRGKPESIIDDEGHRRYLCLDGQYRRGDPDSIKCVPENFTEWLTEWVVAARTGQLNADAPRKTFLPGEPRESNPKGNRATAGQPLRAEDVLEEVSVGAHGSRRWEVRAGFQVGSRKREAER
eukprot:TRINITY_DN55008_c0_g1_i1.p1 TRINITY_DN55008_c0_g1~~TRINITY_DN55008_c0_g1_i1.p1  ORF type:complete len:228 (+),score=27.94 TRINITY_DN55008_c0_g1_i1:83-685(+)